MWIRLKQLIITDFHCMMDEQVMKAASQSPVLIYLSVPHLPELLPSLLVAADGRESNRCLKSHGLWYVDESLISRAITKYLSYIVSSAYFIVMATRIIRRPLLQDSSQITIHGGKRHDRPIWKQSSSFMFALPTFQNSLWRFLKIWTISWKGCWRTYRKTRGTR